MSSDSDFADSICERTVILPTSMSKHAEGVLRILRPIKKHETCWSCTFQVLLKYEFTPAEAPQRILHSESVFGIDGLQALQLSIDSARLWFVNIASQDRNAYLNYRIYPLIRAMSEKIEKDLESLVNGELDKIIAAASGSERSTNGQDD